VGLKLLLTGPPRIGKSTVASRLIELLRDADIPVGGFVTHEQREDGRRVGFAIRAVDGAEAVIAREDLVGDVRVGRYGVDVAAFERTGLPALRRAQRDGRLIVIDEIARMELASKAFVALVQQVFEERGPVVATVHKQAHPTTDALKARPDVQVIEVTTANRDALPQLLLARLSQP
jgi:nucleoside-triphosphatase